MTFLDSSLSCHFEATQNCKDEVAKKWLFWIFGWVFFHAISQKSLRDTDTGLMLPNQIRPNHLPFFGIFGSFKTSLTNSLQNLTCLVSTLLRHFLTGLLCQEQDGKGTGGLPPRDHQGHWNYILSCAQFLSLSVQNWFITRLAVDMVKPWPEDGFVLVIQNEPILVLGPTPIVANLYMCIRL